MKIALPLDVFERKPTGRQFTGKGSRHVGSSRVKLTDESDINIKEAADKSLEILENA